MTDAIDIETRIERFVRILREHLPLVSQANALRAFEILDHGGTLTQIAQWLQHPQLRVEHFYAQLARLNAEQPVPHMRALPAPAPSALAVQRETITVTNLPESEGAAEDRVESRYSHAIPDEHCDTLYRDGEVQLLRPMHPPGPDVPVTKLQEATVRWLLKENIPRGHISGWMRIPVDQITRIGAAARLPHRTSNQEVARSLQC